MDNNSPTEATPDYNPETWVDRYGDYLYYFALARVRDPSIAEDLVQETFIAALNSLKKFKGRSSVKTWLTGILKHKVIDYYRKKTRQQPEHEIDHDTEGVDKFFDDKGQWQLKPAEWTANPQKLYEQQEFFKVLHICLSELSDRLSDVFILREIVGENTEKICKVLNISATNCWVMLHRARMHLRRCLEIKWFSDATTNE